MTTCAEQMTTCSDGLLVRAPAKINLSLLIAGRRPDGFHEIETVMAKVNCFDEILIQSTDQPGIELRCRGPYWAPEGRKNLVYRACELLLGRFDIQPRLRITLTKNLPAGAGLGSGSSDAAAVLLGLRRFLAVPIGDAELDTLATQLGSDIAFFLHGPLAFCTGRGEKIQELRQNFDFVSLLILPNISVSTKKVYANYRHDRGLYRRLSEEIKSHIHKNNIDLLSTMCANMLEKSCLGLYGELAWLKAKVESLGIRPLCLTGSGAAMFCMFTRCRNDKARTCQRRVEEETGCKTIILRNSKW